MRYSRNNRMYNNYDYLYSRPNVSMFSNVVGIEVPVSDFENNFDDDSDYPKSIVFEAGGILHNLVYTPARINRNANGKTKRRGTFTLDGERGFENLREVLSERNFINGKAIYEIGYINIKAINGNPVVGQGYTNQFFNQNPYTQNFNHNAYMTLNNQNIYANNPINSNNSRNINRVPRTRKSPKKAAIPLIIFGIILLGVMAYFIIFGNKYNSYEVKGSKGEIVTLSDFSDNGDTYTDAYGIYLDDNKYTIYYISVEDVNLSDVKEVINLELIVGDEENIADKDYKHEDVVKCQEIQEIKIDNKTYYSLEDYQNKRKSGNNMVVMITGIIGGVILNGAVVVLIKRK